ncbi:hypothetical protein F5884DRAFT_839729 [Xylogone sp. PMI_703]|nr:hypothetical protein F5884DRAFT_839729 [Xylogone sp. PMI_703]
MSQSTAISLRRADYRIGWVCALPLELAAAQVFLDEEHLPPSDFIWNSRFDNNKYTFGRIGQHNIILAVLPAGIYGITSAALTIRMMASSFSDVQFALMVGIGGGVPSDAHDIRLGDVVVSKPTERVSGVLQYDFGKTGQNGEITLTGTLNKPPQQALTAISALEAKYMVRDSNYKEIIDRILTTNSKIRKTFMYPGTENDILYHYDYNHQGEQACSFSCSSARVQMRERRETNEPVVHYGLIGSGNQVIKDGVTREQLRKKYNILCFEMEAAGMMDTLECLVIRGICDYADSHKNKQWQGYAAIVAAAYTKDLLLSIGNPTGSMGGGGRSPLPTPVTTPATQSPAPTKIFDTTSPVEMGSPVRMTPPAEMFSPIEMPPPVIPSQVSFSSKPMPLPTPPNSPPMCSVSLTQPHPVSTHPVSKDLQIRETHGERLLRAAQDGNGDLVRIFANMGGDPNIPDPDWKHTALHYMARSGDLITVRLLLSKGADVNAKAKPSGITPLFEAAAKGHAKVLQCLLQHRANVMDRGSFKKTALHVAAANGHLECVSILLENYADRYIRDKDGCTPLDLAKKGGHSDIVRHLQSKY